MSPRERPSNDNGRRGELPELSPRGKRIELAVSLVVIAGGVCLAVAVLGPAQWLYVAAVLGLAFVGSLVAAVARWFFTGRA